jgi:hypothetical protein
MTRMMDSFGGLLASLPQYWLLRGAMAAGAGDTQLLGESIGRLAALDAGMEEDLRLLSECLNASEDRTVGTGSNVDPIGILRDRIRGANFEVVAA